MISFENKYWLIDRIVVGDLMVNCYIVVWKATSEAIIVDPGDEAPRIVSHLNALNATATAIVLTHGHGDHIGGNYALKEQLNLPIYIGEKDSDMLSDAWLNLSAPFGMDTTSPPASHTLFEADIVRVGGGMLTVWETPGHSKGSISLAGNGFAIVGDLIFQGSIGRTDFPGGSLELLLQMITEKIYPLGDSCVLLPGHGEMTTVGEERRTNPFLQPGFRF